MNILFLDWDGVINPYFHFSHTGDFSKVCCGHIRDLLIKEPNLRIVISSEWRIKGLKACQDILQENGIDKTKIIGITDLPAHDRGLDREHHIEKYLREHPEIENFVIIDDLAEIPDLKKHYVITNSYIGVTQTDIEKAIKILNT